MAGCAKKVIYWMLLTGLGGVFAVAGGLKVLDPAAFTVDIDHYQILPWSLAALTALYLPWLELIAAAALFRKEWRTAALLLMMAMSALFLAGMISAASRGLNIACGCFGSGGGGHLGWAIVRDLGIMAAIVICLLPFWGRKTDSVEMA